MKHAASAVMRAAAPEDGWHVEKLTKRRLEQVRSIVMEIVAAVREGCKDDALSRFRERLAVSIGMIVSRSPEHRDWSERPELVCALVERSALTPPIGDVPVRSSKCACRSRSRGHRACLCNVLLAVAATPQREARAQDHERLAEELDGVGDRREAEREHSGSVGRARYALATRAAGEAVPISRRRASRRSRSTGLVRWCWKPATRARSMSSLVP